MVTLPLTAAAVLFGALGMVGVVVARRRGHADRRALGWGVLALTTSAGVGSVVILGLVVTGGLRMFGVIHFVYLVATVSMPLLGVAAAWASWRRGGTTLARAVAVVLLVPAPVGFYATHIEPFWLRVDHVTVPIDPVRAGEHPVTIGVLADLQTSDVGAHEREAVDRLMAAAPDVIVIPGDLFHGEDHEYERELDEMRALLQRLDAPHGVYFTQGDADPPEWVARMLEGSVIEVLDRDVVELDIGDRRVRLGGHSLHPSAHDAHVVRDDLDATTDDGAITILVAHRPGTVTYLPPDSRVDLTIAGHTHGGQVVVPGFGPPVTLSKVPRHVARGGLHEIDGNQIFVSPGVGMERGDAPQVRLFNRPAVAVLTLR